MHEYSIASRVVELVREQVRDSGGGRVVAVTLRIGCLTCVHDESLRFSFDLLREGTPLADADLRIVRVPVTIHCGTCQRDVVLPGIRRFVCPVCGTPGGDVRAGRELDLESIELADEPAAPGGTAA